MAFKTWPKAATQFHGPQTVTVPAATLPQAVVKTVFRAFSGTVTPKEQAVPLQTLGFGTFTEQGNLVEKYVEVSADLWKALLLAIHGGDIKSTSSACFLQVTGGVMVSFLYPKPAQNGNVSAGSFPQFIPNAVFALLKIEGFAAAIHTWAETGIWACEVKMGDKTFAVPMTSTVGGALFSSDPMALLGGI